MTGNPSTPRATPHARAVAHDLKNVLAAVAAHASLARAAVPPGTPLTEALASIEVGVFRAAELAGQLRGVPRPRRARTAILDLNALAHEVYGLVRVLMPRAAEFACQLASAPILIRANATELRQVVMNLAINAAEAGGPKPGAITLQTAIRRVPRDGLGPGAPALLRGAYAVLDVVDAGPGMTAESLERAFDPAYSTKGPGRGTGLATVRAIVRAHRGAVWVRSAPGRGTHVRVAIPLTTTRARATARTVAKTSPPSHPGAVLVVDDDANLRTLVRRMLEKLGFESLPAAAGDEGVEVVARAPERIAAVLLDVHLPGTPAWTVCQRLTAIRQPLPVVIISGYGADDPAVRRCRSQAVGFLAKPFGLAQLRAQLGLLHLMPANEIRRN